MERIAVVLGKMNSGGIESVVMDYYANLDYSRYQFDFFVQEDSDNIAYSMITARGGRVFLLPSLKKICKFNKVLKKHLIDGEYKIMHVHQNTLSVFALRVGKKAGVPIRISHNHSTSNKKEVVRHLIKVILRPFANKFATERCACSEHAGKWLFGNKQFKKGNVKIINNAIDVDKFKFNQTARDEIRNEWGYSNELVIGNVGRFMPQKNQKFLIDVFKECEKINSDTRLVLVGDGKLKNKLVKRVKKYNLTDKVKFVNPRVDVEKLYSAFDCLALPSIYEGLGRVAIEAQACGLNCLCSTHVPRCVKVTSLVDFLPIKNKKVWAVRLLTASSNRNKDYANAIKDGGYEIKDQANQLALWYDEIFAKHGIEKQTESVEQKPLISILVAVYNVEKYLVQCLNSALNQTYPNIQVVIIDDGSVDKSQEICNRYSLDKMVKLIRQENQGLAEVRNVAIKNADGKYVTFLDGDDFISPYYVENLYNALIKTGASISSCNFVKFYDGDNLPSYQKAVEYRVLDKKDYLGETLLQKTEWGAWGKLYLKETAEKLHYPTGNNYEDLAVFPTLLSEIDNVCMISEKDYVYRQNDQSILHKPFKEKDKVYVEFIKNLAKYVEEYYPEHKSKMVSREFSVYCHLFLRINKKENPNEYNDYWGKIKEYRRVVLKEKHARKKNKIACFVSYFGKWIFKTAFKLI